MTTKYQNSFVIKGNEEDIAKLKEAVFVVIDNNEATKYEIHESYLTNDNKRMFFYFSGIIPIPEELLQVAQNSMSGNRGLELLKLRNDIPFKDVYFTGDKDKIIEFAQNELKLNDVGNINTDELCNIFLNMEAEQKLKFLDQCSIDIGLGKKYLDNIIKYGFKNSNEFCYSEWGCIYNAEFFVLDKDTPTEFSGSFITYHREPRQFWYYLIRKFPNLEVTVRFFEPEFGKAGTIWTSEGSIATKNVHGDTAILFGKKYFGYEYPKD